MEFSPEELEIIGGALSVYYDTLYEENNARIKRLVYYRNCLETNKTFPGKGSYEIVIEDTKKAIVISEKELYDIKCMMQKIST